MALISDDAVAFGNDAAGRDGMRSYASADFEKLKKYFFAVMLHGDMASSYQAVNHELDPFELAQTVRYVYDKHANNRSILLISCWAGWTIAKPFARAMKTPVVAGMSSVGFEYSDKCNRLKAYDRTDFKGIARQTPTKFRAEWIFVHPGGNTEIIPGGRMLNQDNAIIRAKSYVK